MSTDLTTIQISTKARDRLREIASFFRRSMTGQLEWIIEREYEDLATKWGGASGDKTPPKDQLELPISKE